MGLSCPGGMLFIVSRLIRSQGDSQWFYFGVPEEVRQKGSTLFLSICITSSASGPAEGQWCAHCTAESWEVWWGCGAHPTFLLQESTEQDARSCLMLCAESRQFSRRVKAIPLRSLE